MHLYRVRCCCACVPSVWFIRRRSASMQCRGICSSVLGRIRSSGFCVLGASVSGLYVPSAVVSATHVKDFSHVCTDEYIADMFLTNVVAESGVLNGYEAEVKLSGKSGVLGGVRFIQLVVGSSDVPVCYRVTSAFFNYSSIGHLGSAVSGQSLSTFRDSLSFDMIVS